MKSFYKKTFHLLKIFLLKIENLIIKGISDCREMFLFSILMSIAVNLLGSSTNWFLSCLFPIFDCYILCVIIHLLCKIHLKPIGWILACFIVLFLCGEMFTLFFYHSLYSPHVVQLIFETNQRESREFVKLCLVQPSLWYAVIGGVAAYGVSYGIGYCSRRDFWFKSFFRFILFAIIIWSGLRQISSYSRLYNIFNFQNIAQFYSEPMPHTDTPFVRFVYGVAFNKACTMQLEQLQSSVRATTVENCSFRSPLIVLVIGESYNKYHSQIYNPDYLPTTPRLAQMISSGNLIAYKDVVSPFNLTTDVFKYLFSLWDEECPEDWTHYTLFPAIFKKAGYNVYFITNQFVAKEIDFHNVVGGTIFNHTNLSNLQFTYRNKESYQYDLDLLQEIPSVDSLTSHPSLVIVHLIGQHMDYREKYPAGFDKFKPEDEKTSFGGETGKVISSQYDNATYFNDYVVNSLLKRFKDTECIAIYLSDHGEEVYDWRAIFGRTREPEMTIEIARNQYEIPFFFYMSDSYSLKHPDIIKEIKDSYKKPLISTDLCHILLYLGGIQTPHYKETLNILSPQYNIERKRIIRGDVNYDELIKNKSFK